MTNNPLSFIDPEGLQTKGIRNPQSMLEGGGGGAANGGGGGLTLGLIGAGAGAWIGTNITGPMLNEDASDKVVYPDNPDVAPEKYENIPRSPGKFCPGDGSVWERDKSGHGSREGEGSQWKRWPNKDAWNKGKTPNSIWPDARIRK